MQVNAAAVELAQLGDLGNGGGLRDVQNRPLHNIRPYPGFDTDQFRSGNSTEGLRPASASAAVWRAVTCSIVKFSIASLNNRWKLSSAARCRNTAPSPIAARSMNTNSRGTVTGPLALSAWWTWKACLRPYSDGLTPSATLRTRFSSIGP